MVKNQSWKKTFTTYGTIVCLFILACLVCRFWFGWYNNKIIKIREWDWGWGEWLGWVNHAKSKTQFNVKSLNVFFRWMSQMLWCERVREIVRYIKCLTIPKHLLRDRCSRHCVPWCMVCSVCCARCHKNVHIVAKKHKWNRICVLCNVSTVEGKVVSLLQRNCDWSAHTATKMYFARRTGVLFWGRRYWC